MRFYIASRLENARTVKQMATVLRAAGHTHTYDWTTHGSVQCEGEARISEVAAAETRGILFADLVIVLLPGGRGTHTELGIALGAGGKDILICAHDDSLFLHDERTCAFYHFPTVMRFVGPLYQQMARALEMGRTLDAHRAISCAG